MKIASVSEAKNQLCALLGLVRRGQSVLIRDRKTPVALLEPVPELEDAWPRPLVEALERDGLIRRPRHKLRSSFYAADVALPCSRKSVLEALLQERKEGR